MTEDEKQEKKLKENEEQLLIALALLLYPDVDEKDISIESIPNDVKSDLKEKVETFFKKEDKSLSEFTKSDILKTAQDIANVKSSYFKVVTVGDSKTCDNCKKWDGQIISDEDNKYPSYSDFEKSGACHIHCRCYLKPINMSKSMNSEPIEEKEILSTESVTNAIDLTIDNGETEVLVATIGTIIGSDVKGNPVEQHFTEEALQKIAENTKDEILVDAEHQSEKGGTTEAKGWLSKLNFIPGKGLFGLVKWTDIGRKLVENRVFRWLSPSWLIDKTTREPIAMTSVALTNKPSQMGRIDPIINQEPNLELITMEMTKEELVSLIKDTIVTLNSCSEKKEEEVKNEEVVDTPAEESKVEETVETPVEEVKNDVVETPVETPVEEPKVEEKEEVIKIETLNSAPTIGIDITGKTEWQNLHGAEFWTWYRKNGSKYR